MDELALREQVVVDPEVLLALVPRAAQDQELFNRYSISSRVSDARVINV